jgi:head-tail adaptor
MDAGKLDKRVLIKSVGKTADGYGGYTDSVSTLKTIWANVKEVSGDIATSDGKRSQSTDIEVICRTKAITFDLKTHLLQIEGNSTNYRINNIIEEEYKYFDKILATKIS